jgi:ribosome-associated protein
MVSTTGRIEVNENINLDEKELHFGFVRASGPGGQNVNKVSSAVQLRFDVANSTSLPDEVRNRLSRLARNRINDDGILVIEARRYRMQDQNRQDSVDRLIQLIRRAAEKPKIRKKTKPTAASKRRRLEEKHRRGVVKRLRGSYSDQIE